LHSNTRVQQQQQQQQQQQTHYVVVERHRYLMDWLSVLRIFRTESRFKNRGILSTKKNETKVCPTQNVSFEGISSRPR
jgi:hypothetical protein